MAPLQNLVLRLECFYDNRGLTRSDPNAATIQNLYGGRSNA